MNLIDTAGKIAKKYMTANLAVPLDLRPFYDGGIRRGSDYRYRADMNELFPEAKVGDIAEARCLYIAGNDETIGMTITLFGSAELKLNGQTVFKSNIFNERNNHIDNRVDLSMKKGENLLEFTFKKTALGFGAVFGTWLGKWDYLLMRPDAPTLEGGQYRLNGGPWLPELKEAKISLGEGEYALFMTNTTDGPLMVRSKEFPPEKEEYRNPAGLDDYGPWLGLWPLKNEHGDISDFSQLTENTYWRFKYDKLWLRPYYGRGNFGHWNYPLGVTLYGLLRFGQLTKDEKILSYIKAHAQRCVDTFDYALWDRDHHGGAASLHNLLSGIDSLDDCGSFGSLLEETELSLGIDGRKIDDYISDYIEHRQPRLSSGAFCRQNQLHSFHNETVWLDDLYMSVPFLCRRYKITGEDKYLRDAANQFMQYKELLFMADEELMSHVFDLRHGIKTGVPWGRGNGWTVFSLSELLMFMPEDHELRPELEEFFKTLCRGYFSRQSEDGRWHQVLNAPDSYYETSCTAMFACAFMRGVRMGLLSESYGEAARKAVESIAQNTVDDMGNLYGVCRGSEFAFSADYYKYDLLPRDNDTHGIGIVLLAIYEVLK
ncbi:MAG: glycoside hydrolase family 88 protein [Oscillospiraceae bacterium]|nr:glycoside hydrolase family 88 protein [Oscillospiraceae bacterium]